MSVSTFQILVWTTFPYKERFRRCFVSERKRRWEVREALKTMNQKLAFVTSDNPAANVVSRAKWPMQLCKFCEKDETTSAPLPTRRPHPDYGKLPNFHHLSWSATPTKGRKPDNFQPRAQIKRLFEESELVSGDSEAIRKFSYKYIVPVKLVAQYVRHLAQIKMRKE